jgi:hypothetical protein
MPGQQRGYERRSWGAIDLRAMALWPSLDRKALRRCQHDPRRIARLVSHGTSLTLDTILGMLTIRDLSTEEGEDWFG